MEKLIKKLDAIKEILEKVRESDVSSEHTDASLNPGLGGKYGKIHGGDPRKVKDQPESGVHSVGGKPRQMISGASYLRRETSSQGTGDLTVAPKEKSPFKKKEIEIAKNGQWSLDKSVYNAGTHPPKGYEPGKKKPQISEHATYDPKYSFKDNRELVRMHHQDHKVGVKDESHLDSLTRAAAKRGGHEIKE